LQIWNSVSAKFKNSIKNIKKFFFIIAGHKVGNRAGRVEPRARKKRASAYSLLMVPRHEARANILKNGHPPKQRKTHVLRGEKLNAVPFGSDLSLSTGNGGARLLFKVRNKVTIKYCKKLKNAK
jgi:hypothetical protein